MENNNGEKVREELTHSEKHAEKNIRETKKALTERMRENPWMLSSVVLGVITLLLLFTSIGGATGKVISANDASETLITYLNQVAESEVSLVEVKEVSGLYEVTVKYQSQNIPVYVTKDGLSYTSALLPLLKEIPATSTTTQTQQPSSYTSNDLEKLSDFNQCLATKGIKIYGANWCGWTKKLVVETLGGYDVLGNAYIECTENEELCKSKGVKGYPTIKLNDQDYSGQRTLESLGQATGCQVPDLDSTVVVNTNEASC